MLLKVSPNCCHTTSAHTRSNHTEKRPQQPKTRGTHSKLMERQVCGEDMKRHIHLREINAFQQPQQQQREPSGINVWQRTSPQSWTHRATASALHRVHVWRNAHEARAARIVLPPAVLVRICKGKTLIGSGVWSKAWVIKTSTEMAKNAFPSHPGLYRDWRAVGATSQF